MKNLVSMQDLPNEALIEIFDLAEILCDQGGEPDGNLDLANGFFEHRRPGRRIRRDIVMATLFFEPSTRTRLSFESAMHRLGGSVIGFSDARTSSVVKGETLADTIRIVNGYADLIVMRHPAEGSAQVAAWFSRIPIINAGDGGREHPTQCLLDLFTLRRELGHIRGLKVGLLGDLKHGRTVHSLAQGLARLGAEPICISPKTLRMPEHIMRFVEDVAGRRPVEVERPEEVLGELNALYATRIQQERFDDSAEYEALRGVYVVDADLMQRAPEDCVILHPLPRVDEISPEIDGDPRSAYFRQAHYGVPVRMALVALLQAAAQVDSKEPGMPCEERPSAADDTRPCDNPRCILRTERYLHQRFERARDGSTRCSYCETQPEQAELELR